MNNIKKATLHILFGIQVADTKTIIVHFDKTEASYNTGCHPTVVRIKHFAMFVQCHIQLPLLYHEKHFLSSLSLKCRRAKLVGISYSYFSISPFQSLIPPNSTMFVYPSFASFFAASLLRLPLLQYTSISCDLFGSSAISAGLFPR